MKNLGSTYFGSQNITSSGKACQAWTSDYPTKVASDIKDDQFPDNSRGEALNFCRNPQSNKKSGIWCYTMDPDVEWDYCNPCPANHGNYAGMLSVDLNRNHSFTIHYQLLLHDKRFTTKGSRTKVLRKNVDKHRVEIKAG